MTLSMLTVAWASIAMAVPPLTQAQREQLETASDFDSTFESGAVYPLMQNAAAWNAGDETGARIPDFEAILADPAAYRGELFLLEGQMAGPVEQVRVTRPGAWGESVEHWFLRVSDDKNDAALVVRLVDPPEPPRVGTQLRIPARFYKAWQLEDRSGDPATFLTFVGRSAKAAGNAPASTSPGATGLGGMVLVLVMLLAAGFYLLRRATPKGEMRSRELARRHREDAERLTEQADADTDELDEPLPEDPMAALEELSRRRDREA